MKRKSTTILLLLALSLTVSHRSASQQPEELKFEMLFCGIGMFESHQSYRVSDGTTVDVELISYKSTSKAKKVLATELKAVLRISERKDHLDKMGKKIGERVVAILSKTDGTERTILLSLKEKTLYKVEAASARHIEQFLKAESSQ